MAAKRANPADELAGNLLETLRAQRAAGGDVYPLTLRRLAESTGAADALVKKAVARPAFAGAAVVAAKNRPDAPVALREDVTLLAESPQLLRFALEAICTPAKRLHPAAKLATKLVPELRGPFAEAVARRVNENTLPPFAGCRVEKGVARLYLQSLPPLPPPRKPEVVLAERLLQTLAGHKAAGAYPMTLRALLDAAGADAKLAKKALSQAAFKAGVVPAVKSHPDTPLALAADADALADSPLVLEFLLRAARTESDQAFGAADLKKKLVPALRSAFADAVERRADAGTLPPEVGWLPSKKRKTFFFLRDVRRGAAPDPPPPAPDFAAAFDEAFARLDREKGGHNFLSLVELRRAVHVPRADFDAGLGRLRAAGRYTLSAAEGRHGLSDEERAAGLGEDGTLLLYVSRRSP